MKPNRPGMGTHGRISPMFDIGLGIDTDLSGYDNIRMRGLLLGLSSREIGELLPGIAEFAELGDYLDMPVRTYSSGMTLRLTFAVATCFEPEILLMGEWILAGDAHFMDKAQAPSILSFKRRTRWCSRRTISTSAAGGAIKACGCNRVRFRPLVRFRM
jgi:ABC-2 type transport system ATP-binding protein/lipopolysaccharide transport system ATP-binding protein